MHLVTDLENDLVLSILLKKENSEGIDSKDLLPLLSRVRKVLEPVSEKDHSQDVRSQSEGSTVSGV